MYGVGIDRAVTRVVAAALCMVLLTACSSVAKTEEPFVPPGNSRQGLTAGGSRLEFPPGLRRPGKSAATGSPSSVLEKAASAAEQAKQGTGAPSGSAAPGAASSQPPGTSGVNASFVPPSAPAPVGGNAPSAGSSSSAAVPLPFSHPARMTVAYYGGWSAYSGFTPDQISGSNLNILHYAFAKVGADLQVIPSDSYIDGKNFTMLKALKSRYPALRTVISVGGWSDSKYFSDAAATASSRAVFAASAVRFMKSNGFDGVDIDWEYPTGGGLSTNVTRSSDKTNFVLLLSALRAKLDTQGMQDGRHYILSFAGAANSAYAAGAGLSAVAKAVDYGMIMTYDLHGSWDAYTDFNAPLYTPAGQSPQDKASVDAAVRTWLNCGFPAGKLVMGVPFYGYADQGASSANSGLWQRFSSGKAVGFDSICANYLSNASFRSFYDSTAQVPWLYGNSVFVSYDDEASIRKKAQYAVSRGLLGVGAWELGFDKNAVLLRAIKNTLG